MEQQPTQQVPSFNLVNTLLFPTPETSYGYDDFPEELIWVPKSLDPENADPEDCIPCLLLSSPSARFFVLYLHSNAEDLGRCYTFCSMLRYQFQVHVLAVEYPGYGICPGGQATEQSVIENAGTAFGFLRTVLRWPLDGIIIFGRSIGCGPALSIASGHRVYGVILVCPFLSVRELCKDFVGPLSQLIDERFPNKDRVKLLTSPLLLVHGKKDAVVPWSHGLALYQACVTRKRLVTPDDMHHNTNLHSDATFFVLPMLQFFGLPDYNFDEMQVPEWVFNKRLSTRFCENATKADAKAKALGHVKIPGDSGTSIVHFRIVGDGSSSSGPKMLSQQVPPVDLLHAPKACPRPPPSPRAFMVKPTGMLQEGCLQTPVRLIPESEPSNPSSPSGRPSPSSPENVSETDQQELPAHVKQVDAATAQAFQRFLKAKGLERLGEAFRGDAGNASGSASGRDSQPSATGSRAASPSGPSSSSPKKGGEKAEQPGGHSPPPAGVSQEALRWVQQAAWEAANPPELVIPALAEPAWAVAAGASLSRPNSCEEGSVEISEFGLELDTDDDEDDMPDAPDDLGFFKVPATRHGGPALRDPSPSAGGDRGSPLSLWKFAWWTAAMEQSPPPPPPPLPAKVSIRI